MLKESLQRSAFIPNIAALLLGAIMPLSLAPWDWWWTGLISAGCLLLLLTNTTSLMRSFWHNFWFGMGMFGSGASWVYVSIHEHGNASELLAATLTLIFIVAPALSFALPMMFFRFFNQRVGSAIFAFASLWVLAEWFRSWLLTGFPWLYFGYGFIDTPLSGWAPIGGVLAISWIGIFCAGVLVVLAQTLKSLRQYSMPVVGLIFATLLWLAGGYLAAQEWTKPDKSGVKVGVIQPAIPLAIKWDGRKLNDILSLYTQQTEQLNDHDIIVWPESAIPQFKDQLNFFIEDIDKKGRKNQSAIITGIPTRDNLTRQYYNSVIGLGKATGTYHKQHLVPFGEYVPLDKWLRGTIDFFDLPMSRFSSGSSDQAYISAFDLKISTAICYEIVFPDLVSRSAANAQILLTVSNDTWFGDSLGPKQHLQMARMRALENAKPLIRATNDGLTALIDKHGNITASIPPFQRSVMSGKITPQHGKTPFNYWGSSPIILFSFALLFGISLQNRKKIIHLVTGQNRE